jgi:multidrug efflux pump subunit AcrB
VINEGCTLHDNKIKMVESPAGPPTLSSIVLEVTGDGSYKGLERLAYQVETIFKKIPKLVDIDVVNDEIYLKYNIVLSNHKIIQSNLQVEQVEKILYLAFEGMDIAYINDANAQNQIPIHLGLSKESKSLKVASKEYLQHKLSGIMLLNSKGMGVPLGEVVEIKTQKSNHKIISKNLSPLISVIAETDMESQIYPLLIIRDEIKNNLSKQYEIEDANFLDFSLTDKETKEKYLLHWDGEQKLSMDTLIDLGMALGVAIVLIYFMMVIYYNSFLLAGAISLASFISVAGVIYAHLAYNLFTPTTFYLTGTSLIGFIALIGINSRNSLLVIDFAQQLIEEQGLSVPRAIAVSIQTRAKPILLTVLAIIFASMLLATDPVFGGLGIALIGGTLAAYAVSIFIVPIIIYKPLLKQYPTKANESK